MKGILPLTACVAIVWAAGSNAAAQQGRSAERQQDQTLLRSKLQITSSAFAPNAAIPSKFTCDGPGVNPPLTFASIPLKAQSLVLIVDDPDVPKNLMPSGVFDHWLIWDLSADSKGIAEGAPEAKRGLNGMGQAGYMGPCPPDREHRYFFKLYALDTKLTAKIANKKDLEAAMQGHILEQAELMGRYERGGK